MRKRIIGEGAASGSDHWLELEGLAEVAITSEDPDHPIEAALSGAGGGWRASAQGEQVISLAFDEPQAIRRIRVGFEAMDARTQEFVLRWSPDHGRSFREIVRQQYTFSVPDTTRETEDYAVDLKDVHVLELRITPHIGGGPARASLQQFRIA